MNTATKLFVGAAFGFLAVAVVMPSDTAPAAADTAPVADTVEADQTLSDYDLFDATFKPAWDTLDADQQAAMCEGLDLAPDYMLEIYREGLDGLYQDVTDAHILASFATVC